MSNTSGGFVRRAFSRLRQAWGLATPEHQALLNALHPDLPATDLPRLRQAIDACLKARGGNVSARVRAAELGEAYLDLNHNGRKHFLELLATDYGVRHEVVNAAILTLQQAADDDQRYVAESALRQALIPPRIQLLSQFNSLSDGIKFLVDLRAELDQIAKHNKTLRSLNQDLCSLLASWFDVGFLDLRRITWDTPAALLEKLIAYEAVHQIRSWDDLKNRLAPDRRLYAFFHPHMPTEPLIFVQVALTRGITNNVQELLDESAPLLDPEQADSAIFYSISNCQRGLTGVSFGSFLIKQVIDDLTQSLPRLKTFSTLSPIPGFRVWLDKQLKNENEELFFGFENEDLHPLVDEINTDGANNSTLRTMLAYENWDADLASLDTLKPVLIQLCAHYLINVHHNLRTQDRVADFHLSNGACLHRINWLADRSIRGIEQSAGMMVNYLYRLDQIEANHEAYSTTGRIIADPTVRNLLKGSSKNPNQMVVGRKIKPLKP